MNLRFLIRLYFFIFSYSSVLLAADVPLTQVEIYHRCYMRMTKNVVPSVGFAKDLENAVRSGSKLGVTACMELLETANLDATTGRAQNLPEAQQILKTFHQLHSSWFQGKALGVRGTLVDSTTLLVQDIDEPSLYFLKALFGQTTKYNSTSLGSNLNYVFTATEGLRSIRENYTTAGVIKGNYISKYFVTNQEALLCNKLGVGCNAGNVNTQTGILSLDVASGLMGNVVNGVPDAVHPNLGTVSIPDSNMTSFGQLVGVEGVKPVILPKQIVFSPVVNSANQTELNNYLSATVKMPGVNLTQHFGGGILGSQMFIMKNTGLGVDIINGSGDNDGDGRIHRRVAARIMQDLLCQNLPTLKESDVTPDFSSPHTFKQSISCMRCHTSMDPMAYGYRNMGIYRTSNNEFDALQNNEVSIRKGNTVLGVIRIPEKPNSNVWALKTPTGTMTYRDHLGQLKNFNFMSTSDLGDKLLNESDFYRCVTKRYYQFLTGINVNLYSPPIYVNPSAPTYSELHRKKVEDLAQTLKTNRDLKDLIRGIISSDGFKYRNARYQESP